ncbi:uncharacterized protein MONOS_8027 [Monocercomonoides exilis]|uniref:uncharacterized protein n=1 Tax=Monocercomonoides exilis TaxID=2049356 RepID=UPI00355956A6|nr:hypothetical protein MONOS_8027 [Monocercomonoides exilis]|eukprot:MONOS_8027.1-p1 / transcript=MONOS_8027.1 / gene=MONOS_8027 / organism=Monocercomonoides_exilis_PA203 / gene_product=unspecified product / transcript_product=unspecified product / location=Mono_scaffold00291:59555-60668(-) / protein_length=250 / sequence_SO=supercontig / SO=protein_coding / is_pseudo=false
MSFYDEDIIDQSQESPRYYSRFSKTQPIYRRSISTSNSISRASPSKRLSQTTKTQTLMRRSSISRSSRRAITRQSMSHTLKEDEDFHNRYVVRKERSPGPIYDPSSSANFTHIRMPSTVFPHDDRQKYFVTKTITKGPAYDPVIDSSSTKWSQPKIAFPKDARKDWCIQRTPFDGEYHSLPPPTVVSTTQRARTPFFPSDDRQKHFVSKTVSPGVGSYRLPSSVGVKKATKVGGTFSVGTRDTAGWCFS